MNEPDPVSLFLSARGWSSHLYNHEPARTMLMFEQNSPSVSENVKKKGDFDQMYFYTPG